MIKLDRARVNLLLGTAAFTMSSAGSVLLHIVLAISIYAKTGSGLMTSVFVSLQWLPAMLVVLVRSDWNDGVNPRVRWFRLELVSAALTVPVALIPDSAGYWPVIAVLLVRGLVDQVNRINKTVAARSLFPQAKAAHYASFLQSGYHCGIGLAAVAGVVAADRLDVRAVALLDALTFVAAAGLVWFTRCIEASPEASRSARPSLLVRLAEYRDVLAGDRRLLLCALLPPLTATFFQGTYSVLQPIFPIQRFGLGPAAVSMSYVLASIGIVAGSASFSFFCRKTRLFEQPFVKVRRLTVVLSALAALLYIAAACGMSPVTSGALFLAMVVVFEFLWMMGYSGMVALAPKGRLGSVFGISFALGCFVASMQAALVGALIDRFDGRFVEVVGLLMMLYLTVIIFIASGDRQTVRAV
ncbi:MFS transporter [Paraburkholderia sp. SARCC-3016]|uniref:MFS transporter n=1 Tax=Paraburkholderia sp. SARCC-3016 TaxID=3058611 RepID=UPI00280914DA|nr:MFS transporter [Paraburkholderia sp. SARCC-3016]MDQ7978666.1 MFS transporter [Paraburkholderia sp. SARCC-3016]